MTGGFNMVSGHLREQNGMFQMVLTWKDSSGKRRSKSYDFQIPTSIVLEFINKYVGVYFLDSPNHFSARMLIA